MKRKMYDTLLKWKNNDAPETALLIEGARRVGKSYVVEAFVLHPGDLKVENGVTYLPLYMTPWFFSQAAA